MTPPDPDSSSDAALALTPPVEVRPFDLPHGLARVPTGAAVLIYMHDNPDPDALAAGLGLKRLLEEATGARATLALGGIVGRAENRAMVEVLRIPLTPIEELRPTAFNMLAIVDSQPGTGNNSLPVGRPLDIVIDHHPARAESARAPWCDIRPHLGATSTIVLEYLRQLHIPLDSATATALFYALRSETRDLGRESTEAERAAYLHLVPMVDHQILYRISHPKVSRQHFAALDRALRSAEVHGDVVAVNLGELSYPDLVAEVADLLLSFEEARFVLCGGRYGSKVFLSLRADASDARAGTLMRQLIGTAGAAGGHGTMAGGRLHTPVSNDADLQTALDALVKRFLLISGRPPTPGIPLVDR
jgi:nanoRNase/pAp phosphatase (c-di-AMP/oligoRNAs hydrolase)